MKKRATGLMIILSCFLVFAAACGKSAEVAWQEKYNLGEKYLLEENYGEAIVAFTEAIEIDPNQALAYLGRGDAYVKFGETEENLTLAQADYETALALDSTLVEGYLGLADIYTRLGDQEKAIEQLEAGNEKTGDERIHRKLTEYNLELSEEEFNTLQELYHLMEAGDGTGASNYLHQNYTVLLEDIVGKQQKWDAEHPYVFDGTELRQFSDGMGMAFFMIGKAREGFHMEISYGEIRNGKVQGEALVICERSSWIEYAIGTWEDGKLIEGLVSSTNEERNYGVIAEGTFLGDVLWNGTVKMIDDSLEVPIEEGHLVGGNPEMDPYDGSVVYWYYAEDGPKGFDEEQYKNRQFKKREGECMAGTYDFFV